MTRQRNDDHSTEFGLWLRQQPLIDSSLGFSATNLDYIWCKHTSGQWMLLEEKRHMCNVTWSQRQLYQRLHSAIINSSSAGGYQGVHLIQFEKTDPTDGRVYVNGNEVTVEDLIRILQFKQLPPK